MSTPSRRGRGLRAFAGLGLLAAVAAGFAVQLARGEPDVVAGLVGGEKEGLLADPDVQRILRDEYDLVLDYEVEGSLDIVQQAEPAGDFLWPSSDVALALYENREGSADEANIFNSPIVLYSWDSVTEALEEEGIVTQDGGVYEVDLAALADTINQERSWADIGLGELYGGVLVQTTDPAAATRGTCSAACSPPR
jgi:hypothetical protein